MRDTGTVAILEGGRLKYSRLPPLPQAVLIRAVVS